MIHIFSLVISNVRPRLVRTDCDSVSVSLRELSSESNVVNLSSLATEVARQVNSQVVYGGKLNNPGNQKEKCEHSVVAARGSHDRKPVQGGILLGGT